MRAKKKFYQILQDHTPLAPYFFGAYKVASRGSFLLDNRASRIGVYLSVEPILKGFPNPEFSREFILFDNRDKYKTK